jgi:hypothetical protein
MHPRQCIQRGRQKNVHYVGCLYCAANTSSLHACQPLLHPQAASWRHWNTAGSQQAMAAAKTCILCSKWFTGHCNVPVPHCQQQSTQSWLC